MKDANQFSIATMKDVAEQYVIQELLLWSMASELKTQLMRKFRLLFVN